MSSTSKAVFHFSPPLTLHHDSPIILNAKELSKDPQFSSNSYLGHTTKRFGFARAKTNKDKIDFEELYEDKLENEYLLFLQEMDESINEDLVYFVLQSHGRLDEYLEFAKLTVRPSSNGPILSLCLWV